MLTVVAVVDLLIGAGHWLVAGLVIFLRWRGTKGYFCLLANVHQEQVTLFHKGGAVAAGRSVAFFMGPARFDKAWQFLFLMENATPVLRARERYKVDRAKALLCALPDSGSPPRHSFLFIHLFVDMHRAKQWGHD